MVLPVPGILAKIKHLDLIFLFSRQSFYFLLLIFPMDCFDMWIALAENFNELVLTERIISCRDLELLRVLKEEG